MIRDEERYTLNVIQFPFNVLLTTILRVGSGNHISSDIGIIMERTLAWIEHDMARKESNGASPNIKSEPAVQTSQFQGAAQVTQPVTNGTLHGDVPAKDFYPDPVQNGQTPYPPLAYAGQPGSAQATPGGGDPQLFYAGHTATTTSSEEAAAAAAQANPLIAFASQATQHVAYQAPAAASDILWRQQPHSNNTWADWTAAIADSQDRYSANALLNLGAPPRETGPVVDAGGAISNPQDGAADLGVVANAHAGQWPLLLFDGSTTVSGP
jgi:hypothetical protein